MAKGRILSKSLSVSKKFNRELPGISGNLREFCQLLYCMIQPHTDDFGRMQGDPWTVKNLTLPSSPRDEGIFEKALDILHSSGLIVWYEVDGERFLEVVNFDEHQTGLHKRTRSRFPEPSGKFPEIPSEENRREENRREEKEKGGPDGPRSSLSQGKDRKTEKITPYDGVTMFPQEWDSLREKWGERQALILAKVLGDYKLSYGKTYKSDYRAILSWVEDAAVKRGLVTEIGKPPEKTGSKPVVCNICRKKPGTKQGPVGVCCDFCWDTFYGETESDKDDNDNEVSGVPVLEAVGEDGTVYESDPSDPH